MKSANGWGKRLLGLLLTLMMLLGAVDVTALSAWAAEPDAAQRPAFSGAVQKAAENEPAVITLYTLGGTISSAVQGGEPDGSAWHQTETGVYKRVLNGYQRLPNAIAPCYSEEVEFAGWYDSMDYTNRIEDVFVESGSVSLYAKWIYKNVAGRNENMWYRYGGSMADVRGFDGTNPIMTTYQNGGYFYYCKIGSAASQVESIPSAINLPVETNKSIFKKVVAAYPVYVASLVTLDGTYATMHYVVFNAGDEAVPYFSLGYAADVMIGSDDKATVMAIQNEQGGNAYIQMKEKNNGKVFRMYIKGSDYGITDVDRYWIGLYEGGNFRNHAFDDCDAPTTGNDDSALACSWVNRTLPAHSAGIYSVKLGVGELSEMGGSSNTVILDANGGVFRDGSEISSHSGNSIPIASLEVPTRIGYKFDGWYLAREGGTKQTGIITQSITLYAHWKEALYDLVNDTVVQTGQSVTVPKETADITIHLGENNVGRGESAREVIRTGEELSLSLDVTEGYYLPKSIYVDIRGIDGTVHLTEGTGYRYELNENRTEAEIIVAPEFITGDVVVTTIGHPVPAERPQSVEAVIDGSGHTKEITLIDPQPILQADVLPQELPDHTYEYQWYENSEANNQNGGKIPNATEKTYTFPAGRSLGDYYFYCTVTSRRSNGQTAVRTSNYVHVRIKKATRFVTLADKEAFVTGEPVSIGEAEVTPAVSDPSSVRYAYYTDEGCTVETTAENDGAVSAGGAPSVAGIYYVKAFVPEDERFEAAENTPPARLRIKPREHTVTIRVRLDGEDWENHGRTFALLAQDESVVTDLTKVLAGVYGIYDITEADPDGTDPLEGGMDTGVTVTVGEEDAEAFVDYYTVTFYSEGKALGDDTPQKPQMILSGQNALDPGAPASRPGYAFAGWMTQPKGDTLYRFSVPVTAKTDLYAKWDLLDLAYRIEHYLQTEDGTYTLWETEELTGTIGEEKQAQAKEYTGYREDAQNENRIPQGTVAADGSLTLKLYYNLIEYRIDYDLDGGALPEGTANPASYTVLSAPITLKQPEKEGYAFLGWTGTNGSTQNREVTIPTGSTGDRQYTANWEILDLPYRIEHYLQDGTGGYRLEETEELTGTIGEEKFAGAKEYTGYREDTQNENRIPYGTVTADGSLTLKLYYNLIEYRIDYELDGGALPEGTANPTSYTVLSDPIILEEPEKEGYAFIGWTEPDKSAPNREVIIPTGSTGDRRYTANWEIREFPYLVEHYLQDASGDFGLAESESLQGIYGEEQTAVAKEYTGYREDTKHKDRIPRGTVAADGSLVLRLYYRPLEYRIRYETDGGSLPEGKKNPFSYTVLSDEITLVNPQKPGYAFVGWTKADSDTPQAKEVIPTGSTGDRIFTAHWETVELSYRVEHYLQAYGGGIFALQETEQLTGTIGEEKTAEPKEFTGYQENERHVGRIPAGVVTANRVLTLRLYYAPIVYTITYELGGGYLPEGKTNPARYTVQSGEITLVDPVRPGYQFAGWTAPGRSVTPERTVIPAGSAGNLHFTANWTPDTDTPYWVEHYQENPSGDGYALADRELLTGTTDSVATAQAKEYVGFTEDSAYFGRVESGKISGHTPLVLRLYYNRQTYVITFVVDTQKADVHGKTVLTLRHGQAIAKPFVLPKEGYVLSPLYEGWDREVPANAEGDATYTAQLSSDGIGGKPLVDAEREIVKTDTDKTDPKNSQFYPLMLRAYGQEKSVKLKWHRIKGANGYILYGARCGKDMKRIRTIKSGKTTSCTIKNLKEGVYYKYLIVAYKNVNGKKRVTHSSKTAHSVTNGGSFGNPSDIACKPSVLNLKKGKSKTLKPSYKETKPIRMHIAKFRFHSDQPNVASVSKTGKVTARRAGTCNIYVYAQNGFYKKVRVKVTR